MNNRSNIQIVLLSVLLAVCLAGGVVRAKALAGTVIRNQAMIDFETLDGEQMEASSNEVIMVVQSVYGISIQPDGTQPSPGQVQQGVAGQTMTFPYTLTFTGNVKDTATVVPTFDNANSNFLPKTPGGVTGITVFNDLNKNFIIDSDDVVVSQWFDDNADGVLDAAEIDSFGVGQSYQPDETANLIVRFDVPTGTGAGQNLFFGLDGTSTGDATKTDTGNIAQAKTVDDAVLTVRKSADPFESVGAGAALEFTVDVENVGTQAAGGRAYTVGSATWEGVLIYDVLPEDEAGNTLELTTPAPTGSFSGGNATVVYTASATTGDPTSWDWKTSEPAGVTAIGTLTSDGTTDSDLAPSETLSLTFSVTAPTTEQIIENTAHATFEDNTGPATQTVDSNTVFVPVDVTATFGVDIRDTDFEAPAPPKTPPDDGTGATNDTQTIDTAYAGTAVYFTNRVENTGTVQDSYNLSIAGIPAGWSAVLLKSDGITPLGDTGLDGIPDTGELETGETRDIVVRVEIPEDADGGNAPATLTVTAESVADATVEDTTEDIVSAVKPATMNLANNNPVGTADETTIQKETAAGGYVDFPLLVQNTADAGGEFDTYTLTTSGVPGNWTVIYYRDLNEDGILDNAELQPSDDTSPVAPQDAAWIIARIFTAQDAPFDADAGTPEVQDPYEIIFTATSKNNGASDSITDEVLISPEELFQLRPDRNGTIAPGGATIYEHELQNYGSRDNRFYLELTEGNESWSYILYDATMTELPKDAAHDNDYYIDLDEAAGATDSATFFIKLFAPANIPVGTIDITTITASARDHGITATSDAVDTTILVQGDLQLTKDSVPAPGVPVAPGDNIEYTTTFFNKGAQALTDLKIIDQIPDHTEYLLQSGSSSTAGTGITGVTWQKSTDGGITWTDDDSGAGADPSVTSVRAVFSGSLDAGATGSVSFEVQVE